MSGIDDGSSAHTDPRRERKTQTINEVRFETREWLIQEKDLRAGKNCARNRQPSPFASGKQRHVAL